MSASDKLGGYAKAFGALDAAVRRQIIWDRWGCKLMEGWPHLVG